VVYSVFRNQTFVREEDIITGNLFLAVLSAYFPLMANGSQKPPKISIPAVFGFERTAVFWMPLATRPGEPARAREPPAQRAERATGWVRRAEVSGGDSNWVVVSLLGYQLCFLPAVAPNSTHRSHQTVDS